MRGTISANTLAGFEDLSFNINWNVETRLKLEIFSLVNVTPHDAAYVSKAMLHCQTSFLAPAVRLTFSSTVISCWGWFIKGNDNKP